MKIIKKENIASFSSKSTFLKKLKLKNAKILDIGCGEASIYELLLDIYSINCIEGWDIKDISLYKAKETYKNYRSISFKKRELESLKQQDLLDFNTIFLFRVLEDPIISFPLVINYFEEFLKDKNNTLFIIPTLFNQGVSREYLFYENPKKLAKNWINIFKDYFRIKYIGKTKDYLPVLKITGIKKDLQIGDLDINIASQLPFKN